MAPKTEEPWFINKSPTFIGPAPWSDTGAYTVNATLQAGGRPFAIVNVGNKVKTNIPPGAMIPLVDDFHKRFEIPLTHVGNVLEGEGLHVEGWDYLDGTGNTYSFDHFIPRHTKC